MSVAKPLGDGWAFARSRSRSDVSPLLAVHVADLELDIAGATSIAVY